MLQLQQRRSIWEGGRVRVVPVSFESSERVAAMAEEFPSEFQFLSDPSFSIYQLYSVEEGGWSALYSPATLLYYLKAAFRPRRRSGKKLEGGSDRKRLGGDFIIDPEGIIRLAHRCRNPADRPSVERLSEVLAGLEPRGAGETPRV